MLDRSESTLVTYRGGSSSRLEATVNGSVVALSLQTVETSAAFSLSRSSLVELTTFLAGVVADLPPLPATPPVEVEEPGADVEAPVLDDLPAVS